MAPGRRVIVRAVWVSGLAALALLLAIGAYLWPLRPGVVALQLSFTPAAFGAVIHAWPAEHLARYRAHFGADFVLLVCYGAFGWLLATRTRALAGLGVRGRRAGAWALPLAAAFDALENALHLWLTELPRFGYPAIYATAATAAAAKWAMLLGFALLVLAALARRDD